MIVPSYFSELAESQNMQFLLDASQLNLETQSIWRRFLNLGMPQMSLSFDSAIGRERIAAAASVVDSNAPAPLRSRAKLELYKGKIPSIKEKFAMTQDDMRTLEILRALNNAASPDAMIRFLHKDLTEAAVAGDKRIDIMLLQALSTLTIDVSATNNPDGVNYGTIDLLAQPYQTQGVPVVWTDAANSKPVDDIEKYLENIWNTYGRRFGKILMSYETWLTFKQSAQVRSVLQTFYNVGKANATFAVTLTNFNEYMDANDWPPIEIIKHQAHIEVDGKPTYIKPFKTGNVSFVPDGKIGTLFNGISMEDIHRVDNKSYAKFGPTLVSKWAESDPLIEFTAMEMLAFPSVDVDNIFILKTDTVGDLGIA
jgi:hypothetical protein